MTLSSYPYFVFFIMFMFTSFMVVFFKFGFSFVVFFIFLILVYTMFLWFKDIIMEALCGFHNFYVQDGFKFGLLVFIFSEFMFFFGIFWLFFDASFIPLSDIGEFWSPLGLFLINPFGVPLLNSCILLSSAVSVTWCHYNLLGNKDSMLGLLMTIILAFYFMIIQGLEYGGVSFSMSDSVFGGIFFFSTGFHGVHVMLGFFFLLFNFYRLMSNHFNFSHHLGLEFSILYWHFVDVVWLFLFIFVYWWSF